MAPKRDNDSSGLTLVPWDVGAEAREVADLGDRWFLSVAGGLVRFGSWARKGAGSAVSSAADVWESTTRLKNREKRSESASRARSGLGSEDEGAPASTASSSTHRRGLRQVQVVSATTERPFSRPRSRREPDPKVSCPRSSSEAGDPPGVLPLLQALQKVIAEHTDSGGTLKDNERFWTLCQAIESLTRGVYAAPTFASVGAVNGAMSRGAPGDSDEL